MQKLKLQSFQETTYGLGWGPKNLHFKQVFQMTGVLLAQGPYFVFFCLFFSFFKATSIAYVDSQARGSNQSYSCQPQPQQHGIWAISGTYITAHSNARSLTHWMRSGIEPSSSWILVRFINHWAMKELWTPIFNWRYLTEIARRSYLVFSWWHHLLTPNVNDEQGLNIKHMENKHNDKYRSKHKSSLKVWND